MGLGTICGFLDFHSAENFLERTANIGNNAAMLRLVKLDLNGRLSKGHETLQPDYGAEAQAMAMDSNYCP